MQSFHIQQNNAFFNPPPEVNPPPQIFGGSDSNGSPSSQTLAAGLYFADDPAEGLDESNDAKRRRIARV